MSLSLSEVSAIQKVSLPAVWNFFDRRPSILRCHSSRGPETVPCRAAALKTSRGIVTKLSLSLLPSQTLLIGRRSENDLFETSSLFLTDDDFRVSGNTLIPSKRAKWSKHPDILPGDIGSLSGQATSSWTTGINFVTEIRDRDGQIVRKGLRTPQIGALHAVAAHWSVSNKPALVVMPTGTGKTEVMLACMVMRCPQRLLVLVPTDALRQQTFRKFLHLGMLPKVGAVASTVISPVVGMVTSNPCSEERLALIGGCNVVVSTVAAVQHIPPALLASFLSKFDAVFFDEAHHVPATSWERIFENLATQTVLQFTATPFRLDGRRMPGRIIYNFPLRMAQEQGYFRRIHFKEVFESDPSAADLKIAEKAVQQLRADLAAGHNHLLLARASTTARAAAIFDVYATRYPDLSPTIIHSKLSGNREKLEAICAGKHRIIVCVDMFGEGFDLPSLKIAALHDPHKSLAITLQFTGRFTRDTPGIGDATLVANTADPHVSDAIEELYAEDSDWNALIPELSAKAIQSQMDFSDFLERMERTEKGDEELFALNVLHPKTSTVIFKVGSFTPRNFRKALKKGTHVERVWHSKDKDMMVFITRSKLPIEWASIKEAANEVWDLFILAYDTDRRLLFIHSSQKGTLHHDLAECVGGKNAQLLSGERMFRAFSRIGRLIFHNVGLYNRGTRLRFRMYTGLDIGEAINPALQTGTTKSNLFAVGFENGQRVSVGVSHKGRVWSMSSSSIPDWRQWCSGIADKILDDKIPTDDFLKHTLIPKEISQLPSKEIFTVSLPNEWYSCDLDKIRLFAGDTERDLHNFGVKSFRKTSDHDLELEVAADDDCLCVFKLQWGPAEGEFSVTQNRGPTIELHSGGMRARFDDYLRSHPPVLMYMDGSEITGPRLLEPPAVLPFTYDPARVQHLDWAGVDITKESQWKHGSKRNNSVQGRMIEELLKRNNHFVFDDDDTGEIADIVEIVEGAEEVRFNFYHCKYSGGRDPGLRAKDCYEVCGQAVRSVRWTFDPAHLVKHLQSRENPENRNGRPTRLEKGCARTLANLKRRLPKLKVRYAVTVVQPGLSKAHITPEIATVLGAANTFLTEMTGSPLTIIGSA